MKTWDAIIVGAGPAGCAAAYDLAVAGHEVLLIDKADFPRQKACAGGLTIKAARALRYSIEPVVRQKIASMRIERGEGRATIVRRHSPYCFMTVRQEFDDFCLRQTLSAGAQFQRIRAIEAITSESAGVTISADGERLHARFLVGADGVHSRVRQLTNMGAGWIWRGFAVEATVPVPNAAAHDLVFDFAAIRCGYGWVFPKADHLNIGLYSFAGGEAIDRARLSAYIRNRSIGSGAECIIGQHAAFGATQHKPAIGRIFLAGDAGGFVDPLTGEGIYFAIVSGQAAARAIERDFASGISAHEEFARATARIRTDLGIATSGAHWFYQNLDVGYRLLSVPVLHRFLLNGFADGSDLASLAARVKTLISNLA
ncbi:MAG: geranylgeranyl reductase family protein [Acidobacteriaceae bacterium]|nr:geranylgeranyl reductase family protein [Acidobacteriaceae bacterium]